MNYTIPELDERITSLLTEFQAHHVKQNQHLEFYENSAFYNFQSGDTLETNPYAENLIQSYADKNIFYTSVFPQFKRPYKQPTAESRSAASAIEKAVRGVWRENDGEALQAEWANDGTLLSEFVTVTEPRLNQGQLTGVDIQRFDPRFCAWEFADSNGNELTAFYAMKPMSKEEIEERYNVTPNFSGVNDILGEITDGNSLISVDGRERFFVIWRWDREKKACWVGDKWIVAPYDHQLGEIPVDRCTPFVKPTDSNRFGYFFIDRLLKPQAEYNLVARLKSNFAKKMGNPLFWVRGLIGDQLDEVKKQQKEGGGALSFKQNGDAGFVTPPETKIFDEYMDRLEAKMGDRANMPPAAFGSTAGANTSGDALHFLFQPVSQAVAYQWIQIAAHYRSINRKILRYFEQFALPGQQFQFENITFVPEMVEGFHETEIVVPAVTPKDDIQEKRFWLDGINSGAIPRVTGYEGMGFQDAEDQVEILAEEFNDPRLHPEKFAALQQGLAAGQPVVSPGKSGQPGQPGSPGTPGTSPAKPAPAATPYQGA